MKELKRIKSIGIILLGISALFLSSCSYSPESFEIGDALTKKKSEDYYKLEYALNNGCLPPTWLVDTKHSTYEGKDVIKGTGRDNKDEYVFYSDLTAKNINTGKTAIWTCAGIENLDIIGNPLPTDEEMHQGAIYDNGGNIVADEYERDENNRILKEEQDEIERQNFTKSRLEKLKAYEAAKKKEIEERQNEPCWQCSKVFKFRIWRGGQHESGSYWGGWNDVEEQKTGWVKCKNCDGYGLNWDYNSAERRPESSRCRFSRCVNGWMECDNWRKHRD